MTDLSSAAQAVLDAWDAKLNPMVTCLTHDPEREALAAALRAVADQLGPYCKIEPGYAFSAPAEQWHYEFKLEAERKLLAIATELEGHSQ